MSYQDKIYIWLTRRIPYIKKLYDSVKKRRYKYLYQIINERRCLRIMEIGLFDGEHALKMIHEAKKYHGNNVEYYGFDLFEEMNSEIFSNEAAKHPLSYENIFSKLKQTGCKINLYKGCTHKTLPQIVDVLPNMDLIFIDGGHSLDTINNDWKYSRQLMSDKTVTIFDDYWNRDDLGCKRIIEDIDRNSYRVKILPIQDKFKKDWGTLKINFVRVETL